MPAFEGLVLGTEKPAVVFDIGRVYTKWVYKDRQMECLRTL